MVTDSKVPEICPLCGRTYGGGVPDPVIHAVWLRHHRTGMCIREGA